MLLGPWPVTDAAWLGVSITQSCVRHTGAVVLPPVDSGGHVPQNAVPTRTRRI